jgi:hypothetical protein
MSAQANTNRGGNGSVPGAPSARELIAQGQKVREDVAALAGAVREATHGWEALLRDRLERRPYATLAVAAGVGYVLGGGLPTSLLRVMIGIGGRLVFERALTKLAATDSPS